jgi:hypothetical protein
MLVFVDESGDPGMEPERGASDVFVTVAVIFEDDKNPLPSPFRHATIPETFRSAGF